MVFTPQSCRMIDDWKDDWNIGFGKYTRTMDGMDTPALLVQLNVPWLLRMTFEGLFGVTSERAKAAVWESPRLWRFGTFPSPGLLKRHQEGSKQQTLKDKGCVL